MNKIHQMLQRIPQHVKDNVNWNVELTEARALEVSLLSSGCFDDIELDELNEEYILPNLFNNMLTD